jgi:hypothetical protein
MYTNFIIRRVHPSGVSCLEDVVLRQEKPSRTLITSNKSASDTQPHILCLTLTSVLWVPSAIRHVKASQQTTFRAERSTRSYELNTEGSSLCRVNFLDLRRAKY